MKFSYVTLGFLVKFPWKIRKSEVVFFSMLAASLKEQHWLSKCASNYGKWRMFPAELTAGGALVDREVFSHPLAQQLLVYTECSLFEKDAMIQLE